MILKNKSQSLNESLDDFRRDWEQRRHDDYGLQPTDVHHRATPSPAVLRHANDVRHEIVQRLSPDGRKYFMTHEDFFRLRYIRASFEGDFSQRTFREAFVRSLITDAEEYARGDSTIQLAKFLQK